MKLTQTEQQICDDYEQLSLFSYFHQSETYTPIKDYAKHGSGFVNGKYRIKKFFVEIRKGVMGNGQIRNR